MWFVLNSGPQTDEAGKTSQQGGPIADMQSEAPRNSAGWETTKVAYPMRDYN